HSGRERHDVARGAVDAALHAAQPGDDERVAQRADVNQRVGPEVADFEDEGHAEVMRKLHSGQADGQGCAGCIDDVGAGQGGANAPGDAVEVQEREHAANAAEGCAVVGIVVRRVEGEEVDVFRVEAGEVAVGRAVEAHRAAAA